MAASDLDQHSPGVRIPVAQAAARPNALRGVALATRSRHEPVLVFQPWHGSEILVGRGAARRCGVVRSLRRRHRPSPPASPGVAAKFAELAFVQSDYAGAHALLSPQLEQATAGDKLAAGVGKMHPKGRPSEVKAIEFEPLPGQRAMNIYLKGTQSDEEDVSWLSVEDGSDIAQRSVRQRISRANPAAAHSSCDGYPVWNVPSCEEPARRRSDGQTSQSAGLITSTGLGL